MRSANSEFIVENCRFIANTADDYGGALYCTGGCPQIRHSLFYNNYAGNGGGAVFGDVGAVLNLVNCTVYDNNSFSGWTGIASMGASLDIVNSIISGHSEGFAIWAQTSSDISIAYSCFFANNSNVGYNSFTTINLSNNTNLDPLFIDPLNADFHLQSNSPCIDAGDPDSPLDPDGTIADIGAYYFAQSSIVPPPAETLNPAGFTLYAPFPNPFNAVAYIGFTLDNASHAELRIFDITGREVQIFTTGHLSAGVHNVVWNAENLESGVYFVRLTAGVNMQTRKLVLMK